MRNASVCAGRKPEGTVLHKVIGAAMLRRGLAPSGRSLIGFVHKRVRPFSALLIPLVYWIKSLIFKQSRTQQTFFI